MIDRIGSKTPPPEVREGSESLPVIEGANVGADPSFRPAALIPSFNNLRTVGKVVETALRMLPELLAVDDGSTDGTLEALAAFGSRIRFHRHPRNLGKGRTLRDGFALLSAAGFTHAIALDADGQHFPEDIPLFLKAAAGAPGTLLIGERDRGRVDLPRRSRVGLWFSNAALRLFTGVRLRDSQCGFRAYPLARVLGLALKGDRYDLELEVLIQAAWAGIPIAPVPIRVSYAPEGGRVTHFRPVRDSLQIMGRLARQKRTQSS